MSGRFSVSCALQAHTALQLLRGHMYALIATVMAPLADTQGPEPPPAMAALAEVACLMQCLCDVAQAVDVLLLSVLIIGTVPPTAPSCCTLPA
jgi:hypothetical protein